MALLLTHRATMLPGGRDLSDRGSRPFEPEPLKVGSELVPRLDLLIVMRSTRRFNRRTPIFFETYLCGGRILQKGSDNPAYSSLNTVGRLSFTWRSLFVSR
jgi:hypothetical protein